MIFNMTGGGVKKTLPVLNAAYPADTAVTYSGTAVETTFEVRVATDGYPAAYSYQWYVNDVAVANATRSTYTLSTSTKGVHTVYCTVTSEAGTVYSRTATLAVNALPVLNSSYPNDASVTYTASDPASATFKVVIDAAGYPTNYTYQWYVDNSAVPGATSSSYTMTGLNSAATHSVYCKVANDAGSVNSRTATLVVTQQKLYLFNEGSINTTLTGGIYGQINGDGLYYPSTVLMPGKNTTFTTKSAIDLTNVNTIKARFLSSGTVDDTYFRVHVASTACDGEATSTSDTVAYSFEDGPFNNVERTITLDVTSISGNYYVGYAWGVYGGADTNRGIGGHIYEWWLE